LRSIGHVTRVAPEEPAQVFALGLSLEFLERTFERKLAGPEWAVWAGGRGTRRVDCARSSKKARALDDVAQLADVAWETPSDELAA
jgi:hypothetical protein